MIIEDKITEFMDKIKKVNENIIYLADIHFNIVKIINGSSGKTKRRRSAVLVDQLFQKNYGSVDLEYHMNEYKRKLNTTEKDLVEIHKVVLKKEISCSFYKR